MHRDQKWETGKAVIVDSETGMVVRLGRECLKGFMDQAVLTEVQRCILEVNMLALGPLSPGSLDLEGKEPAYQPMILVVGLLCAGQCCPLLARLWCKSVRGLQSGPSGLGFQPLLCFWVFLAWLSCSHPPSPCR